MNAPFPAIKKLLGYHAARRCLVSGCKSKCCNKRSLTAHLANVHGIEDQNVVADIHQSYRKEYQRAPFELAQTQQVLDEVINVKHPKGNEI